TGPVEMGEHLRHLSHNSLVPISCLPNAGLPSVVDGKTHYDLTPEQLSEHHARFITEFGVSVVGGCCGTTPEHLRLVVDRCRDVTTDMNGIASRFATQVRAPLVLDSTEPQVMEAGLQWIGGRAVLNSANLEDGEAPGSRLDRVFSLAREYGAAVICLLIDEEG